MRPIVEGGVAIGVVLTVCFSVGLGKGPLAQHEEAAARLVPSFDVNGGGLVEALLRLGEQERVPMGIEYVDADALEKPVKISLRQVTVAQALDALLPQESGYSWRLQDGRKR
ncbi:MAG TPA: hypothetical protein VIX19_13810 [Terriglobales bacterium]